MANCRGEKPSSNRSIFYLSCWCVLAILLLMLQNGFTEGMRHRSFDEYEDPEYDERPSIENLLENVRSTFSETLTYFSHFLVDIFKLNDNISYRNHTNNGQCVEDDTLDDPFEDNFLDDDWSRLDAAVNTGKSLQGFSTSQMISYFQDRYNNSDILPSVENSFIYIIMAVNRAENHIANYNHSIPTIMTRVSDLEGESFFLGQKLIDSRSINSKRNKTIQSMETENVQATASLSKLKNLQNVEYAKLDRLHASQKSLVYDNSFFGMIFLIIAPLLAIHQDVITTELNIRRLVVEVKLSEMHLAKLQGELNSLLEEYEATERLVEIDLAEQLHTNSTLNQTKAILEASVNDGVKIKKVATFFTLLHGKLKVLYDVTISGTPKDIIKAINVNDILDLFEKDETSGAIVETLVANETANKFRHLIRSSRLADEAESLDCSPNTPIELTDDETDPFRRKRAIGVSDSDIEIGDQMLMNVSGVYQAFRKVTADPDEFRWDQLFSATAIGTAVLSDLTLLAFSTPDIVLTRIRSFNPKKQKSTKSGPESFRNILNWISNSQYSALVQYQSWMSQLQIISLSLPDSLKTTIILLRALLGNPKSPTELSPEVTQLFSLQLNNTLMLASENFRNQSIEIENSFQRLVDFTTQLDGASITWKERRRTSHQCSSTVKAENNVYNDEILDSSIDLDRIQSMIEGWNNLIVSLRIIRRTVKELVIPELEAFQYLVEWSVQLATQRHQAGQDSGSPALPLIHRLISQAAKVSRAVYLLHETSSVYLRVSTRHLMPQTISVDEILALDHPLSAQDLDEKRREIDEVGRQEAESIAEMVKEAKHQMIVKLMEHENLRQPDHGNQHCSFERKVDRKDIKDCVHGRDCDRYFLKSFVCA